MAKEKGRGWGWLVLAGVMLIAWGVIQYLGIEWWPAMLIIFGAFLVVWGLLAARGKALTGFEKE